MPEQGVYSQLGALPLDTKTRRKSSGASWFQGVDEAPRAPFGIFRSLRSRPLPIEWSGAERRPHWVRLPALALRCAHGGS